jgi:hypothetical protein
LEVTNNGLKLAENLRRNKCMAKTTTVDENGWLQFWDNGKLIAEFGASLDQTDEQRQATTQSLQAIGLPPDVFGPASQWEKDGYLTLRELWEANEISYNRLLAVVAQICGQ